MFRLPKSSSSQQSVSKRSVIGSSHKIQGLCNYSRRKCNFLCLENYEYCLKHILEDKTAPYKPCQSLYTVSGKKCGKPAHRHDRKDNWLCPEHSRKANLNRQKATSRRAPPLTQEALLASLSHYARTDQSSIKKREANENGESSVKQSSRAINPFVEVDAAQVNARCSQVLDYASDSDSDVEVAMLDSVWRAQDHESSDAESVDSQAEDPLKHAGVYTAEEVTVIIKDKMIRLQSLYIDQFRRLHHLLKERRRKYLHALKKEKETLCSIHDQEKTSAKEQKLYEKLKATNHFHRYYSEEAVLHKKALDRRAQVTEGTLARISHKGKCAFTEGGVKCGAKTLPVTKYCRKHILEDTQQVLFRACGFKRDDHTCQEPTLNVFENATCVYHITLATQPHSSLDMSEEIVAVKEEVQTDQKKQEDPVIKNTHMVVEKTPDLLTEAPDLLTEGPDLLTEAPDLLTEAPDLLTEAPDLLTEDQIKLEDPVIPAVEAVEPVDALLKPVESTEPIKTPAVDNADKTSVEATNETKGSAVEKMEIDDVNSPPLNDNLAGNEGSPGDLVMVDMMTDVGVVEEVLESEEKQEFEESMQLGPENDNSLGND